VSLPDEVGKSGSTGAPVQAHGVASDGGNNSDIYSHGPDCAVEAARVTKAGDRLHREKISIRKHGLVALAHDNEGNLFGIHPMP